MRRTTFLWLSTLILLAAAGLRLIQLAAYPPGPHYDEAVNVILTRNVAFGGAILYYFPIVPNYQGREILYYTLAAPLFGLLGDRIFTLRLTSAFLNLLTIAAAIGLGRVMFPGRRGAIVGLAAGALMALSFPQVWLARQAFRAVTLPLMQALALLLLWRGLTARRRAWAWLVAGGVCAGGALYTYMASRLFPVWLLLGGLILLTLDRGQRAHRLRQGLIFFGALALSAAPMGIYALQHPDIFLSRLSEVTATGAPPVSLGESIVRHLRMFFLEGDPLLRYNVPGRPYFSLPEGLLLLVGIGVAWRRLRHGPEPAPARAAYGLALLAPLMVIPGVISVGGLPPSHLRALGMVPLIFILVGVGVEAAWRWLAARIRPLATPQAVAIALTGLLVIGGPGIAQTYFAWAGRADLYEQNDADTAAAAAWFPAQADDHTDVFFNSLHYDHPTVLMDEPPPFHWLKAGTLFWPSDQRDGLYLYPRSAPPDATAARLLAPYALDGLPPGPDGRGAFTAYRVPAGTPLDLALTPPQEPVRSPYLSLIGIAAPALQPGTPGRIVMAWHVDAPLPAADVWPILQFEDALGNVLDRAEFELVGTDRWPPGGTLIQALPLTAPPGTPPGEIRLKLAWVARGTDTYLPFLNRRGDPGIAWAGIGAVRVTRPDSFPSPEVLPIQNPAVLDVAPGVQLRGWNLGRDQALRPGGRIPVDLFWQAVPAPADRAAITVEALLIDPNGGETPLWAGAPVRGTYPSDRWADGELLDDRAAWEVPLHQPPGPYRLAVRIGQATIPLGEVAVADVARRMEPPAVAAPLDVRLGDSLRLAGYTLTGGEAAMLEIAWQAVARPAHDYTVFVHLVDAAGATVRQIDRAPLGNTYPTSLWAPGEYVLDGYLFDDAPPGLYRVQVGLYLQSDGLRLPVLGADGLPGGEDSVWLGEVRIVAAGSRPDPRRQ